MLGRGRHWLMLLAVQWLITCYGDEAAALNTTSQLQSNASRESSRSLQLDTDADRAIANKLRKYFELRSECAFELNEINRGEDSDPSDKYCASTADYLTCFPSVPANTTLHFPCPYRKGLLALNLKENFTRFCDENGAWSSTNYAFCIQRLVSHYHSVNCRVKENSGDSDEDSEIVCDQLSSASTVSYELMLWANLVGFFITIVLVSMAIFVFLSARSLRCVRNMIHCNMLFTFLLKCSTYIAFYVFVMMHKSSQIWNTNHFLCGVFNVLINYSLLCSFFWMMIEAVYLITVIVAAYSSNKIKLWWYLFIGWVAPIFPIIPYALLSFSSNETACSWIRPEYNSRYEMFIDVPIYILLAVNSVLLIIILYVIITKLRHHNDAVKTKYSQYKKLIRATLVLFPLFGLTYAVFFWLPSENKSLFAQIYYWVNIFLQSTQGIWVAFVYCFLNEEVKNVLRAKFQSWKVSHVNSSWHGYSSSNRHHSIPTLYTTQMTSNGSFTTRTRTEAADAHRLATVQEANM
nr:G protein-coupled receptor [Proales similis]